MSPFARLELEKPAAKHGREGEGDEEAHHDGKGHRQAIAGKEASDHAPHERQRQENHDQRQAGGEHRQHDFARADARRLHAIQAMLFHVAENILVHHHSVIDHDADRQDQPQHRDVVERKAHVIHESERRHDRRGDGERGDDRGSPIANEKQNRGRHQPRGQQEVKFHLFDRFLHEPRLIARDLDLHIRRQCGADAVQLCFHIVGHFDDVRARLLLHHDADSGLPVEPGKRARLLDRIDHLADILDADRVAAPIGDDDVVELGGVGQSTEGADHHLARALLDMAAGNLDILPQEHDCTSSIDSL